MTSHQYRQILSDIISHLESLKEDGVSSVDVSAETLQSLRTEQKIRRNTSYISQRNPVRFAKPESDIKENRFKTSKTVDAAISELNSIAARIEKCKLCALHKERTKTVPGQGNPQPEILFVGEGPGEEEDIQGLAFVGRAGQLLTKMIAAMGFKREEVFIANIVKCRPPGNRAPMPEEMEACMPYLLEQISLLNPRVIVALGATAAKGLGLLDPNTGITKIRGNWHIFKGIDVMPTFHPSYLLRNPSAKKEAWADLQAVLKKIGRPIPPVGKTAGN